MDSNFLYRTEILLGQNCVHYIQSHKVIIFGIGGVGSWCAESLVRSGIQHITLVDYDTVCPTNINRQAHATHSTVGQSKTDVMRRRLLDINPEAHIDVISREYSSDTSHEFSLGSYDIIVDAIDSFYNKMHLIQQATQTKAFFISSMGAARKLNPQDIRVGDFWDINYCFLARKLRKKLRKQPKLHRSFPCVYSVEQYESGNELIEESGTQKRVNGSIAHITALFGFFMAGKIMNHLSSTQNSKTL
ncbi:MAG: tRNA threonylcarbamoyladenosine dehydratase [Bacteroidales bacterium]|jgi:tRNA A37 threonylcarbamoyladenosine dehydratase|nr:tRNA threonylcarbamoyladenosine dehydratase [Bacteroidales bacterium]